jgi:hypothetical protein
MRIVLFAIVLSGCIGPRYSVVADNVRAYRERAEGNDCDVAHVVDVGGAAAAIGAAADELGLKAQWPPAQPISVCVVTSLPYVSCPGAGRPLAGCTSADGAIVRVSTQWTPKADWILQRGYDWRGNLVHELVMALTLRKALNLPHVTAASEGEWVKRKDYRALVTSARGRMP